MAYVAFIAAVLAAGIIAMWSYRRSRWAMVWWFPVAGISLSTLLGLCVFVDDGLPLHGPGGGGGEGIIFLIVWGCRLVVGLIFIACVACFPRDHALNPRVVTSAVLGWLLIGTAGYIAYRASQRVEVCLIVTDPAGRPIPSVGVRYRYSLSSLLPRHGATEPSGIAVTDAQGRAAIPAEKFMVMYVDMAATSEFASQTVEIYAEGANQYYLVNREWSASVPVWGSASDNLRQMYADTVSSGPSLTINVDLASLSGRLPLPYDRYVAAAARQGCGPGPEAKRPFAVAFANLAGLSHAAELVRGHPAAFQVESPETQALTTVVDQARDIGRLVHGRQSQMEQTAQGFRDRLIRTHQQPLTPAELSDLLNFVSEAVAEVDRAYDRSPPNQPTP